MDAYRIMSQKMIPKETDFTHKHHQKRELTLIKLMFILLVFILRGVSKMLLKVLHLCSLQSCPLQPNHWHYTT